MIWPSASRKIRSYSSTTCRRFTLSLALNRNDTSKAIEVLQAAAPYELGLSGTDFTPALYPVYVRGEAYLAAHQGSEAAAEFQKILDQRGAVRNEPIGALAHLGLGPRLRAAGRHRPRPALPIRISSRSGKTPTPTSHPEASQSRVREAAIMTWNLRQRGRSPIGVEKSAYTTYLSLRRCRIPREACPKPLLAQNPHLMKLRIIEKWLARKGVLFASKRTVCGHPTCPIRSHQPPPICSGLYLCIGMTGLPPGEFSPLRLVQKSTCGSSYQA